MDPVGLMKEERTATADGQHFPENEPDNQRNETCLALTFTTQEINSKSRVWTVVVFFLLLLPGSPEELRDEQTTARKRIHVLKKLVPSLGSIVTWA